LPKKSGGERIIETPGKKLKDVQRILAKELVTIFGKKSPVAHAFLAKRSVITNALPHINRQTIVRVDLTDFFHQINFGRVKGIFTSSPFSFPDDVATVLAHICCLNRRLPQGAPTSPILSNFCCLKLDKLLHRLAKRYKARYTRYADDLTFSFARHTLEKLPQEVFICNLTDQGRPVVEAGLLLSEIIKGQGFQINHQKTRGTDRSKRQMVTGVVVNDSLRVPRKYIDQIRTALYLCKKLGTEAAEKLVIPSISRKKYASGNHPSILKLLKGKLAWIARVSGKSNTSYQQLASKFNAIAISEGKNELQVRIEPVVNSFEEAKKATWFITAENIPDATSQDSEYDIVTGTAFRYLGNVWITCAHCVGNLRTKVVHSRLKLSSHTYLENDIYVRVVDIDWHRDIATLRPQPLESIPRHLPYFLPSQSAPTLDEGSIGLMGFPSSLERQFPIFMRATLVRDRVVSGVNRLEIDKQILKGSSGGPLFDEDYRLIGIVVEGATVDSGMNSCIAARELCNLKSI
jgi:RNA-directed DNA polymerase